MFKIFFSKEADRQYQKLSKTDKNKIDRILIRFALDPFKFSKKLRGEFKGLLAVRAWPYRITFTVDRKTIFVVSIRHRQEAYKK